MSESDGEAYESHQSYVETDVILHFAPFFNHLGAAACAGSIRDSPGLSGGRIIRPPTWRMRCQRTPCFAERNYTHRVYGTYISRTL